MADCLLISVHARRIRGGEQQPQCHLLLKSEGQKKGPVLQRGLKGSLNQKVSKGPEETSINYLRVFPW
jgi:hypothetical protein